MRRPPLRSVRDSGSESSRSTAARARRPQTAATEGEATRRRPRGIRPHEARRARRYRALRSRRAVRLPSSPVRPPVRSSLRRVAPILDRRTGPSSQATTRRARSRRAVAKSCRTERTPSYRHHRAAERQPARNVMLQAIPGLQRGVHKASGYPGDARRR